MASEAKYWFKVKTPSGRVIKVLAHTAHHARQIALGQP